MNRRGFLKFLPVAPMAAKQAAAQAGANVGSLGFAGGIPVGNAVGGTNPTVFSSFAKWLTPLKKREVSRQAVYAFSEGGLDPDIASLQSVSGAVRRRMQIRRNHAAILEQKQSMFDLIKREKGEVSAWDL